jgi:hypothetical protein
MRKWFDCRSGIALIAIAAAGCAPAGEEWAEARDVTPAFLVGRPAAEPSVASDGRGTVILTWITRDRRGADAWLARSRDGGLTFMTPVRFGARADSAWSDPASRPIAWIGGDGRALLLWSERRGGGSGAVDLLARASADGGVRFGPPVAVNDDVDDHRLSRHAGAAVTRLSDGALLVVWNDDRERRRNAETSASLFDASSGDGGATWSDNRPIAGRARQDCRPAIAASGAGLVAVGYRSIGRPGGVSLVLSHDDGTNFPLDAVVDEGATPSTDAPGESPALTVEQRTGWMAWAGGARGARLARWSAAGGTDASRAIDDGLIAAAHPRLAALDGGTLIALESRPRPDTTRRAIAVRMVEREALTPWMLFGADADQAWLAATGPRTALVAWREGGARGGIRLVQIHAVHVAESR